MKPITREWLNKAEGDFATLEREFQAQDHPNYDAVCFHAQQCAEKYLKACMCEANIRFGKIHDLVALLDMIVDGDDRLEGLREDLAYLSDFAVSFRYPGESANIEDAKSACGRIERVRVLLREILGL